MPSNATPAARAAAAAALLCTSACVGRPDAVTGPGAPAGPAAVRIVAVSYELHLPAGALAAGGGAALLGVRGMTTVDSVTAPDGLVATLADALDGEVRLVVAGALPEDAGQDAAVRVWGTGPAGVPPVALVREAVDGATLEQVAPPAGAAVAVAAVAAH